MEVAEENVRSWENVCDILVVRNKEVSKQEVEWSSYFVTWLERYQKVHRGYPCSREDDFAFPLGPFLYFPDFLQ